MSLTAKILTGMVVGLLTGLLFQWLSLPPENFLRIYLVDGLFDAVGQIFIVSLKMLVVPLVFVSLTCGAAKLVPATPIGDVAELMPLVVNRSSSVSSLHVSGLKQLKDCTLKVVPTGATRSTSGP